MNILDLICLGIISLGVIVCALRGFRMTVFRLCSFVIAMFAARLFGKSLGGTLFPELIKNNRGNISSDMVERINAIISTALGTLIIFLGLFIVLRLLFKIINGRMVKGIRSIIVDRLLGALVGLLAGAAVVFLFTEIVYALAASFFAVSANGDLLDLIDNSTIFKFIVNLN